MRLALLGCFIVGVEVLADEEALLVLLADEAFEVLEIGWLRPGRGGRKVGFPKLVGDGIAKGAKEFNIGGRPLVELRGAHT